MKCHPTSGYDSMYTVSGLLAITFGASIWTLNMLRKRVEMTGHACLLRVGPTGGPAVYNWRNGTQLRPDVFVKSASVTISFTTHHAYHWEQCQPEIMKHPTMECHPYQHMPNHCSYDNTIRTGTANGLYEISSHYIEYSYFHLVSQWIWRNRMETKCHASLLQVEPRTEACAVYISWSRVWDQLQT